MKKALALIMTIMLLMSLSIPAALAERGPEKNKVKKEIKEERIGKALKNGWAKFELEGTITSSANMTAMTFNVKIRSATKSIRRVNKKRGDVITIKTTDKTLFSKSLKPPIKGSLADLGPNSRVHVKGRIDRRGDVVEFTAIRVIIKPIKP